MCNNTGMQIYFSLLVGLLGGMVYYVSSNPKIERLALCLWWVGWLAFLLNGVPHLGIVGK